jgi:predicted Holliday junction resolvase-like endonuclease
MQIDTIALIVVSLISVFLFLRVVSLNKDVTRLRDEIVRTVEQYENKLQEVKKNTAKMSRATIKGQLAEQMFPFAKECTYSISDMKFLGQPIDFIVYDGMSDGDVRRVVFVEIKTDTARLSPVQKSIREAIMRGDVHWETIHLNYFREVQ